METLPKKYILDTVEACREYNERLIANLGSIETSLIAVHQSAEQSRIHVETTFQCLIDKITDSLIGRKRLLLEKIQEFKTDAERPLILCQEDINTRKNSTDKLMADATRVLDCGGFSSTTEYKNFMEQSGKLGSLPEVPDIEYVPNITFQGPSDIFLNSFMKSVDLIGNVSKIGPVQITSIEARPGSLLVRWEEIDFDLDEHIYRLQIADQVSLDVTKDESLFREAYTGTEHIHIERDLKTNVTFSFRVCCRSSDRSEWSAWSFIKTGCSQIPPYSWDQTNPSYVVSDNGKMARMIRPGILYSAGPQISSGHCLQVSLANYKSAARDEGVALCAHNSHGNLLQEGTIFVSFQGQIFVDGVENRTMLPALQNNSKMSWNCEVLKSGKWRITIEVGEKCVTYDWNPQPLVAHLYFSAAISQPDAHILVH